MLGAGIGGFALFSTSLLLVSPSRPFVADDVEVATFGSGNVFRLDLALDRSQELLEVRAAHCDKEVSAALYFENGRRLRWVDLHVSHFVTYSPLERA